MKKHAGMLLDMDIWNFKWARGCPWNEETCSSAAYGGHLELLKWAREMVPWMKTHAWELLKWSFGTFEMAHENGCPWDDYTCRGAARGGHLELLKWAHENGCPWHESAGRIAAEGGHLELLKWAHENGCPWDEYTCSAAAERGYLEILKWARQNGCPWDEATCFHSAYGGHLEMLIWARQHGCPWDENRCLYYAKQRNHQNVVNWIESNLISRVELNIIMAESCNHATQ
ncbi:ankyrin repeat protein [Seminavis robusta]|uniref:Ankyrin repeat protein n=1 Tax=Seminavis robusta TaxID=568900 RepID=A0A9N8EH02_9STRA|nr:ankyrin repeat protein [Seminavis robusta]|eukprot:Sro1118_g243080.1 ankyrin repeat protein (229) ;mRNA; r:13808-14494